VKPPNAFVLSIDAGTGSGRAVLFDAAGHQVAVAQEEWTHHADPAHPGSMNFDWEANWALLARAIRRVLHESGADPSAVQAVSATSMREGIVLYDQDGRELWACANVDARAGNEVRALSRGQPQAEREAYQASGQTFALAAQPRLLWVREHQPEVYERAQTMNMISDWVLTRLSGEIASEPSNGCTTGVFSLERRAFAPELAKSVGLRDDLFPRVVEPGTVIGGVHRAAAADTGLLEGTRVVMGGGDAQMGCVGLGVVRPGQTAVLGGSFWQQEINLPEPVTDPEMNVRVNCHAIPDAWQAETIVFFAGLVMRWFRDAFCEPEKVQAAREGVDAYTILEHHASEVPPGAYGILPIFSDEMRYANWYHAAPSLLNLSLDPVRGGKAAIFRALLENAAIVTSANLDRVSRFAGVSSDTITFAGGASKGVLWCQILADVTGKAVRVPAITEATALGTAIAAGVGAGLYSSLSDAGESLVRWEREYEPNAAHHRTYLEVRERWAKAYAAQRALVDQGITESLWKAPGL
jgi:autoinducer 2 (AI-2) kinase